MSKLKSQPWWLDSSEQVSGKPGAIQTDLDVSPYEVKEYAIEPGDLLVLYTDGLTEAINHDDIMFGQKRLEACLKLDCKQKAVFVSLVDKFNDFCGDIKPVDDVTLACIPCIGGLMHPENDKTINYPAITCAQDNNWRWYMELVGSALYEMNPAPMAIEEIQKLSGESGNACQLTLIMSRLYENVIARDVMDKDKKSGADNNYIKIGIKSVCHNGVPSVFIKMDDSGDKIENNEIQSLLSKTAGHSPELHNSENGFICEIKRLSGKQDEGNTLEAIIYGHNQEA